MCNTSVSTFMLENRHVRSTSKYVKHILLLNFQNVLHVFIFQK